jgi:two-component sensor histidine kinase
VPDRDAPRPADDPSTGLLVASTGEERERLAALRRTNLLDSAEEELFDRYVRVASEIVGTPIALISLIDEDRQWFKARKGLEVRETPRDWAFCDHAIKERGVFEVSDALEDERFANNPLVTGEPRIRFYAGAPVTVAGDHRIGTLCVIDQKPHRLTEGQRSALIDLAAILSREIDTNHLAEIRADRVAAARAAAVEIEHQMRNMFAKVGAIVAMTAREDLPPDLIAPTTRRRVLALAQANEVAMRYSFQPAPLAELLAAAVGPASERAGQRPDLEGDGSLLGSAAASVVVPLIDELAQDSYRRGVLGSGEAVTLSWEVKGDDLVLRWCEAAAGSDPQASFESAYVRETGPMSLRGKASVAADGEGLAYELRVPASLVS